MYTYLIGDSNATGKIGLFVLDRSMTARVFLCPAEYYLPSRPSGSLLQPPSAPILPSITVFPNTTIPSNHLTSNTSTTTSNTTTTTSNTTTFTNTNTFGHVLPTNTPIYLNTVAAGRPQNLQQLLAAPPPRINKRPHRHRLAKGARRFKRRHRHRSKRAVGFSKGHDHTIDGSRMLSLPLSPVGRAAVGRYNMWVSPRGSDAPQEFGLFTPGEEYDAAQARDLAALT